MRQTIDQIIADACAPETTAAGIDTDVDRVGAGQFGVISDTAAGALSAAVGAARALVIEAFGHKPSCRIDQTLLDQWCIRSIEPVGWTLPGKWDEFSRDYRTADGWLRLHTNASHHRAAALSALGGVSGVEDAIRAMAARTSGDLEAAIVGAGGCAAELRTPEAWRTHPQGRALAAEPLVAWHEGPDAPTTWRPVDPARPLTGLRVLDLTRVIAGPVSTRFLASLGADVLRIDPGYWHEGANEMEMSVGKTCAGLDLKDEDDRAAFEALLRSAHVLVHGYRGGALDELGFDAQRLATLNPALITVALSAYGWTGPWRHRRGFDSLVQRSTGLAVLNETGDGVIELPFQVLDHGTGYMMAAATLNALRTSLTSGRATHARLSLARLAMLILAQPDGVLAEARARRKQADAEVFPSTLEESHWGPLRRLKVPYSLSTIVVAWDRAAHPLRSDPARWRSV